jgi:5-methylthioadenosine/S-adenosylhomocysteine deaminase
MQIDSLIIASWVIPVEPDNQVLLDHAVAVQAGQILDVLPAAEALEKYQPQQLHQLDQQALIPGLINAHSHASMNLLRGLADDLPLMTWLQQHIWPAEQKWMGEEFVADGSRLAIAEMLRGGTTCFNDMYFHPNITAHAAAEAGIRAQLGMILIDFPSSWADGPAGYIHKGLELRDQYAGHPLIRFSFAPHAPYSVSDDSFNRLRTIADELDPVTPIHIHVHESRDEIEQSLAQFGERPLRRLERLGLLSPALQAVHMTQLEDDEIELVAASGCQVIHCPESNLKLASGFCPVSRLLQAGVNVALGTDGAASNNDLDMFSEMRSAALLAKGISGDPAAVPAATALRMATLNGAKALGLEDITGSIQPGKAADLVAVDLSGIHSRPLYNPISQLVYSSSGNQVSQVWINGRQLVKDAKLTRMDETALLQRAQYWQTKITVKVA